MTAPASAYPRTVEDLMPHARRLASDLGQVPSRNRLVREFRIGSQKASALRDSLIRDAAPDQTPTPIPDQPAHTPADHVGPAAAPTDPATDEPPLVRVDGPPGPSTTPSTAATAAKAARRPVRSWPVFLIALPAFVAIWSGWVGLGSLTGFGLVHPLPGIWDAFSINSAITLPIGVEVYAAYALRAWLSGNRVPTVARRFAKWSAIASLGVGSAGQVAYHLMESAGVTSAPWQITTAVSCLPVIVLGMGAALAHLLHMDDDV